MARITDSVIDSILDFLQSEINYIGIGTGAKPSTNDVLLEDEVERKLTTKFLDDNTLVLEVFWDVGEANGFEYTNTGAFGDGATGDINTGALFAGGAIDVEKVTTETLTVTFEITVEEGV